MAVLTFHLPALFAYGFLNGNRILLTLAGMAVIGVLLALAAMPGGRVRQSLAATMGLMSCSAVLVALSHDASVAHFHFFVMTILVALYQDWRPFVTAFVFVLGEQLAAGVLSFHSVSEDGSGGIRDAVLLAVVHGAFIAAAGAVLMVFWGYSGRSSVREETYRMQLLDTEMGAIARMREAGQMREDLISSVSHEFRTPLTAINGVVATLRSQGDRIPPDVRDTLLAGLAEHGQRLSRLLEDMLAAASAAVSEPTAVADVTATLLTAGTEPRIEASAAPGLVAVTSQDTLDHVVGALVRHGLDHARAGRGIRLEGGAHGGEVLIVLRYAADADLAEGPTRLLEPFASRESAVTGRPISLDLYLARRLAEVDDGRVEATVDGTDVTVTVRLRGLRAVHGGAAPVNTERVPDSSPQEQVGRR
ncbi:MAG: histidine kinase dimerization/phospho-acceptor domain-containing protein [Pseudonocardiales bacterium]